MSILWWRESTLDIETDSDRNPVSYEIRQPTTKWMEKKMEDMEDIEEMEEMMETIMKQQIKILNNPELVDATATFI